MIVGGTKIGLYNVCSILLVGERKKSIHDPKPGCSIWESRGGVLHTCRWKKYCFKYFFDRSEKLESSGKDVEPEEGRECVSFYNI